MSRWAELIEGDNQRLSMRSVITYLVTFTLCVGFFMAMTDSDGGTAMGVAGILSTLVGIIYGVGKWADSSVTKAAIQPQSVNVENVESVTVSEPRKTPRKPTRADIRNS